MRNPGDIADELAAMGTMLDLTGAFEGLASMHVAQIKNRVVASQKFFAELWGIYNQIRVDDLFRFGREEDEEVIEKDLILAITAEGGFSGDIDKRLVEKMLQEYDPKKQDVIVIGHHGALQLARSGVNFKRYFKLPSSDTNFNVEPLVAEVKKYQSTVVFYQSYISLMQQQIKRLQLHDAVTAAGQQVDESQEVIDTGNYIFEPNSFAVMAHLERSMTGITLGQTIFDSKLAQYASRFRAMSAARDKSEEAEGELRLEYNHAKRARSDERLKEIINGMKAAETGI